MSYRVAPPTLATLAQQAASQGLTRALRQQLADDPRTGAQALLARLVRQREAQAATALRLRKLLHHERQLWRVGFDLVAGVDEVGMGPLAGPVVAAAVILPPRLPRFGAQLWPHLDDSKRVTAARRVSIAQVIEREAVAVGIGVVAAAQLDAMGLWHAGGEAMRRAVAALPCSPEHLLVDARRVPHMACQQTPLVGGDGLSQSIAAASIVAKVVRDGMMRAMDLAHPGYGFAQHMGYGTAHHVAMLAERGPCIEHRHSFTPVAQAARRHGGGFRALRAPVSPGSAA